MKKLIAWLLTVLMTIQVFCSGAFAICADASENVNRCYAKIKTDGAYEYVPSVIIDEHLLVDIEWLSDSLSLNCTVLDTIEKQQAFRKCLIFSNGNADIFNYGDSQCFAVSKQDVDLVVNFSDGDSEATVISNHMGCYTFDLGAEVTSATDENGNVNYYVPLFAFCNIFNAAYSVSEDKITLSKPEITAVDIMHMQDKLDDYKAVNHLYNAINDDTLSFLALRLAGYTQDFLDYLLSAEWGHLKDIQDLTLYREEYERIALMMCTTDATEVEKIGELSDFLSDSAEVDSAFYDAFLSALEAGKDAKAFEDLFENTGEFSFAEYEKFAKKCEKILDTGNSTKIADTFGKAAGASIPLLLRGAILSSEISSAQDNYVENMKIYLKTAEKLVPENRFSGSGDIENKVELYESKGADMLDMLLKDKEMQNNITSAVTGIIAPQYGALSITNTLGEWGVNALMGGVFDFKDCYMQCRFSQSFMAETREVVDAYLAQTSILDMDMDTYKSLEWTRLKSCYVANDASLEFYRQSYETLKNKAENNGVIGVLWLYGFDIDKSYSEKELAEFREKLKDADCDPFAIDQFMDAYNDVKISRSTLEREEKAIEAEQNELARYMAVLLYGIDGLTSENAPDCKEFAESTNAAIIESEDALYQPVAVRVLEAKEHKAVADAEMTFVSDDGRKYTCTTNENGVGVTTNLVSSLLGDMQGDKKTEGVLDRLDPESQNSPFSQYEPVNGTSKLYLPLGTYTLTVTAAGYEDYEHDEEVEVTRKEKCDLGDILLGKIENPIPEEKPEEEKPEEEKPEEKKTEEEKPEEEKPEEKKTEEEKPEEEKPVSGFVDWKEAYAQVLRTYISDGVDSNYAKFSLCYVDDDDIPELVVHDGKGQGSHADTGVFLYSFYDGKLFDLGQACNDGYSTFTYFRRTGYVVAGWMNQGVETRELYKLSNGELTLAHSYFSNEASASEDRYSEFDGVRDSDALSKYEACLPSGRMLSDTKNSFPLTESNIMSGLINGPVPIKENTTYKGGWSDMYDGWDDSGIFDARFTREFVLKGDKVEVVIMPFMSPGSNLTYDVAGISENTYYLENGESYGYSYPDLVDSVGDGTLTLYYDCTFELSYPDMNTSVEEIYELE